ncbi:MAG TPA: crosslink repair DNA glycosylase YcaQ family protein [Kofleriaceae bacterium]
MEVSLADARRIAIAAQGFVAERASVGRRDLLALAQHLGVIQIDSVNVLARSHYLPAFSRIGAYAPAELDALSQEPPRTLFEYWGHEASLLPIELWPAMRFRMDRAHLDAWGGVRKVSRKKQLVADVLALVRDKGPIAASELELGKARRRGRGGWWGWSEAKTALEWLFWSGQITSARRRNFERLYDLPERVIPKAIFARAPLDPATARELLIERSARAMGVATETDLRDYYRLDVAGARAAIASLVERGVLELARVESWAKPAYVHRELAPAASLGVTALLSPFDSLIWMRERTERLFGMRVRLEIYTPAHKRVHGYYVLPMLHGDTLVARVDLKADRAAKTLRAHAAHAEAKPTATLAAAMAGELARMASWLGLERVEVTPSGDLGPALARATKPKRR